MISRITVALVLAAVPLTAAGQRAYDDWRTRGGPCDLLAYPAPMGTAQLPSWPPLNLGISIEVIAGSAPVFRLSYQSPGGFLPTCSPTDGCSQGCW
jgi:hypothetical protein